MSKSTSKIMSEYFELVDRLWKLNQSMVRQSIEFMEFENDMLKKRAQYEDKNNDELDLPF